MFSLILFNRNDVFHYNEELEGGFITSFSWSSVSHYRQRSGVVLIDLLSTINSEDKLFFLKSHFSTLNNIVPIVSGEWL